MALGFFQVSITVLVCDPVVYELCRGQFTDIHRFFQLREVITLSFVIFCTAFGTNRPAAAATIPRTSTLPMIFFFIQLLLSRFPLLYCIISFSSTGIFLFPNLKKDAML